MLFRSLRCTRLYSPRTRSPGKDVIQWMLREITSDDRPEALRLLQLLLDKGLFVQADLADNPDLPAYLRNPLFDEEKQYCFEEVGLARLIVACLLLIIRSLVRQRRRSPYSWSLTRCSLTRSSNRYVAFV